MSDDTVSVVLCAYDLRRWEQLVDAVASIAAQSRPVREVVVVIDHNPPLLARARQAFRPPFVQAVPSDGRPGLSGARNTGVAAASSDIVAFLDDDATAEPTWIERLVEPYAEPLVLACGGAVVPALQAPRPAWWPAEFDWVIGCSYVGMPTDRADVRNVIGANMSARRRSLLEIGGFPEGIGRVGARPVGCEETDLYSGWPASYPAHGSSTSPQRGCTTPSRPPGCPGATSRPVAWPRDLSKALVARRVGSADALSSERAHALKVLPAGMARALRDGVPRRALANASSLALTTAGYIGGRVRMGVAGCAV